MKIQFFKYHGAGNDFILADNRNGHINHQDPTFIQQLCHRRFGIGADGVMFLQDKKGFDFEMVYYNSDGKPSSMCGNGGRCLVAFAKFLNIIKHETTFLAVDGPHYARIAESGDWVSLQMIDVDTIKMDGAAFVLDTGSPHYVSSATGLGHKDVVGEGRAIRNSKNYKEQGININFVEDLGDHYYVRTYERGVEDETYACGTGVTAVALAMAKMKGLTGEINTAVTVKGGNLNVRFIFDGTRFKDIFLEGPATFVYRGEIDYMPV